MTPTDRPSSYAQDAEHERLKRPPAPHRHVIECVTDPPRHAERCHATVKDQTQRWRERSGQDNRCDRPARYLFNDKPLCALHAGDAAIVYLLTTRRSAS